MLRLSLFRSAGQGRTPITEFTKKDIAFAGELQAFR
jgi:hypothetical protein